MKWLCIFLFSWMLWGTMLCSQEYYTPAQKQLMARRAAVLDGYRQLGEQLAGVKISATATVRDFVSNNEEIGTNLQQLVIRAAYIPATRYLPDHTCEVDMVLSLQNLVHFLELTQGQYQFPRWKGHNFQTIFELQKSKLLKATGRGIPPLEVDPKKIDSLKNENRSMRDQIDQFSAKTQTLQEQLDKSKMTQELFIKLSQANRQLQEEIQQLRQTKEEMQLNLDQTLAQNQQLQSETYMLRQELQALQRRVSDAGKTINILNGYRQKYEQMGLDYQELQAKLKELEQAKLAQQTAQQEGQKWRDENDQLRAQLAAFEKKSAEEKTGYQAELAKKEADAQTKIQQLTEEKSRYQAETEQKLTQAKETLEKLTAENSHLAEQNKNGQVMVSDLSGRITQLQEEVTAYQTQPSGAWISATPQQKLMARRGAILDGYHQLVEALQGVRLDGQITVKEFVTERAELTAAIEGFVRSAQVINTRCLPDGTCEVDMAVDLDQFIKLLQRLAQQYRAEVWQRRLQAASFQPRSMFKITGAGNLK